MNDPATKTMKDLLPEVFQALRYLLITGGDEAKLKAAQFIVWELYRKNDDGTTPSQGEDAGDDIDRVGIPEQFPEG